MTEVLKERDMQLEMKKRLLEMRKSNEEETRQQYEEAQIQFQKVDREKMEQRAKWVFFRLMDLIIIVLFAF